MCDTCMHLYELPRLATVCPGCGSDNILVSGCHELNDSAWQAHADSGVVCGDCGLTLGNQLVVSEDWRKSPVRYYQREFYLREVLGQLSTSDPPVPEDILELFKVAAKKRNWTTLSQERVQILSRSITATPKHPLDVLIPPDLQEKYKITKTNQLRTDMKKYAERWRSISKRVTGDGPPIVPAALVNHILDLFGPFESHFERNRHKHNCKGEKNCHKTTGCRHNIIAHNYFLKKAILAFYRDRNHPKYKAFKRWLPGRSAKIRRSYFNQFWRTFAPRVSKTLWSFQLKK